MKSTGQSQRERERHERDPKAKPLEVGVGYSQREITRKLDGQGQAPEVATGHSAVHESRSQES